MFQEYATVIEPDWTEAGHLAVGGYMMIFDRATDCLREHVGLGRRYATATHRGVYVVEAHISYSRELAAGDAVEIGTLVVDADAKKVHLYHEMRKRPDGTVASAIELIAVHVDRRSGRAVPFPTPIIDRLNRLKTLHARAPLPSFVGRRLSIDKNQART